MSFFSRAVHGEGGDKIHVWEAWSGLLRVAIGDKTRTEFEAQHNLAPNDATLDTLISTYQTAVANGNRDFFLITFLTALADAEIDNDKTDLGDPTKFAAFLTAAANA